MGNSTKRLKLPHESEGLRLLLKQIKDNVTGERTCLIAGIEVRYMVCSLWPDGVDAAVYDEEGNIYLPDSRLRDDHIDADLTAFHEQVEVNHKFTGRSHAYAHRRALLEELLAAKQIFGQPAQLRTYLHERIGPYPDWKVRDKRSVEDRLYELLMAVAPLKGKLLEVITQSRL